MNINLTDDEYALICVALSSHASSFRARVDAHPYPGSERNIQEIESLRDRFMNGYDTHDYISVRNSDREDFHSDG